ncbi:MAG: hypothetical protein JW763_02175 [candidate division Zixibacteria bacterium]|nr:hypothetical protein [candidate division Zixibacteria bacterium]
MRLALYLLAAGLIALSALAQVPISGDITAHMDSIIIAIPDATPSGLYLQPGSTSRDLWRVIIQNILTGQYDVADSLAEDLDYRVVEFTNTAVTPNKVYYILERTPESTSRYWGTFVFNPAPDRCQIVIQCPHSVYDLNTGKQGFLVFRETGARACFINGAHRCNGETYTPCDGTTQVCSETSEPYRYSDQAHVVLSTFQITTEEMLAINPNVIVIQPHGFSKGTEDPDVIMSNGTRDTPSTDYLLTLRDNLLLQDNSLTFKIVHVDLDWDKLTAQNNVQGRLLNGSSDPCENPAYSATGRFLHLEQAYAKLRNTQSNWYKLANAVALTFPAQSQIISAQSGSWTDPSTWQGGVQPTVDDDVLISAGHTISVDDTTAVCHSLNFGNEEALIDMNAYSKLAVYGNITLAGVNHNVFSAGWSADSAYVCLAGSADTVYLRGWNTEGASTSFRDLIIDKDSASVVMTGGGGMRLAVQNSLDIVSGKLIFTPDDDLEARWASSGNLTNSQSLLVTVHPDGKLLMPDGDGTHFIRSGTGSVPIGLMTIYGEVELNDASSYDISIGGIDVKAGGTLLIGTGLGSTTYGPEFNPGTITVDSGGNVYNITTSDVWFDTSIVNLMDGGTYKTSSSTTVFPPTLINDGKVRYQRDPSTVTTDQVVVDTGYKHIEFSFNGNETRKIWTLADDRVVTDSFIVNNDAEVLIEAEDEFILTVGGTLRLTSGILNNSDADVALTLADGAMISRATGTITNTPTFQGMVDVRYTSYSDAIGTGPELPSDPSVLRHLIKIGTETVTLGADVTVNGTLSMENGVLTTGAHTITLANGATIDESTGITVQGKISATRNVALSTQETFGDLGVNIIADGAAPGATTVIRTTGTALTVNGETSISRYVDVTPTVNSGLQATMVLHYVDDETAGITETLLVPFRSDNGGVSWTQCAGVMDVDANTCTISGIDSFSRWTLAPATGFICGDVNDDAAINLLDILFLISYIYGNPQGPAPDPIASGDVNGGDGAVNLLDILYLISYIYGSPTGPAPDCP